MFSAYLSLFFDDLSVVIASDVFTQRVSSCLPGHLFKSMSAMRIFAQTNDSLWVRCEKDLTEAIDAYEASGNSTPLRFRTIKVTKTKNIPNIQIEVIPLDEV